MDMEAVLDEDGNKVKPAVTHMEKKLVTKAGERYGIRYSEDLSLECAYQRWRMDKLEARLNAANYMARMQADWATGQTEQDGSKERPSPSSTEWTCIAGNITLTTTICILPSRI